MVMGMCITPLNDIIGFLLFFVGIVSLLFSLVMGNKRNREYQEYQDFIKRVKIRNPDRVARLWTALTPEGRASIQNHEQFLEDEAIAGRMNQK